MMVQLHIGDPCLNVSGFINVFTSLVSAPGFLSLNVKLILLLCCGYKHGPLKFRFVHKTMQE